MTKTLSKQKPIGIIANFSLARYQKLAFFLTGGQAEAAPAKGAPKAKTGAKTVSKDVFVFNISENRLVKVSQLREGRFSH